MFLILAGSILSIVAQKKAKSEFKKINGTYSSLSTNIITRSVTVRNLTWQSPRDSFPHRVKIGRVQLRGISFFRLIFKKQLYAQNLLIDSGTVQVNRSVTKDSAKTHEQRGYSIEIKNITLRSLFFESKRDSVTEMEGLLNLRYGAVKIESSEKILTSCQSVFRYIEGNITNLKIRKSGGFYTSVADKLDFNSQNQQLYIDSLKLIPNYGKYEFAKVSGKQVSRLSLAIRRIEITGLNYPNLFDSLVSITKISVQQANFQSFRDRRTPFTNTKIIAMPMTSFQELPVAMEIDSITINNATITVEDFAPLANHPGFVNFQKLNAVMVGLSNRYYSNMPKYVQLNANALIMGTGLITASFRFPLDGSPLYSVKGKVSNFSLINLNPILENSTQVRIESGQLNELFFNFNYTDFNSTGTVEINYENLRLSKLNFDKGKSTDHLKTALINAILKRNKNESTEQRKRIGTINIARDQQRNITNFWWKSLQAGLKSSVLGNEKK